MAFIYNTGYCVVDSDPNTIPELQSGHKMKIAVSDTGSNAWVFREGNSAGTKWVPSLYGPWNNSDTTPATQASTDILFEGDVNITNPSGTSNLTTNSLVIDKNGSTTGIASSISTIKNISTPTFTNVTQFIDVNRNNTTADAPNAETFGQVVRIQSNSTFEDEVVVGSNLVARKLGSGKIDSQYASLNVSEYNGTGDVDFLMGTNSRAEIIGSGIGTIDDVRGLSSFATLNNTNVVVNNLRGATIKAELLDGTVGIGGILGANIIADYEGGNTDLVRGAFIGGQYDGEGNISFLIGASTETEVIGTGSGIINHSRGLDASVSLNNPNALVNFLQGAHINVSLSSGTVGDIQVALLDYDYSGGSITGDFAYLRIQNGGTPSVGGNAYAIQSLSPLDSDFAGSITAKTFIPKTYTVATLPTPTTGMVATVTDATSVTYRSTATGGGSEVALVFYNGTNWIYH